MAGEFRVAGIELRGIGGRMDMPAYCAEQHLTPAVVREICQRHRARLVVAGSSVKLTAAAEKDRAELLDFSVWADALGIPYIRVFGGGAWGTPLTPADYQRAAELVNWWRQEKAARRWRVDLLLETHDAFSASEPCLRLNQQLAQPLHLIWDSHHTWRVGGESLSFTWKQLGPLVRHVHVKDSVDRPSARHPYTYVLPGDGQMPLGELIALLQAERFDGFRSLEWERFWHPYLPPLRDALARLQERNWFSSRKTAGAAKAVASVGVTTVAAASAPATADPYAWWQGAAVSLLKPLAALMVPDKADLPLKGQASNHGAQADRLESFARPCLLAAHWLASEPAPREGLSRGDLAQWFRQGLVIGTDPSSPEYWGPTANHHQHTVEMGALTLALQIARSDLWEPLSTNERRRIAQWFGTVRGAGLHRNNHIFFCVLPLAFLDQEGFGRPADRQVSHYLLDVLEGMALGGGWFLDGMNETVDYYAAYAWAYYGLWWAKLYGHGDPKRAARWKHWAAEFLKDYAYFFAASGETPPFGRSLCYRFAASAPFGLAEHCGVSAIPPGQARRICTSNLEFFLQHAIQQEQGALSLGWTDEFAPVSEAYSCAGSVYWAAKGFAPLLLSPRHEFWRAKEQPAPAAVRDFQRAIPQAGLSVRGHEGEVEVFNNANGICVSNLKFGAWKWGKLSYRSGFGFEVSRDDDHYPLDAALTAEFSNGHVYGRHQCQPLEVEAGRCGSVYGLGDRFSQNHASVETRLWWKAGWQLHWHHIVAHQPAVFRLGTYSLPLADTTLRELKTADDFGLARDAKRGVAIQPLLGFRRVNAHESDPARRSHLLAWHSLTLAAETETVAGELDLVALVWAGRSEAECRPWEVVASTAGRLHLRHPDLGDWRIEHEGLPPIERRTPENTEK